MRKNERGSALIGSVAATVLILTLTLGVIQIVFTLYARNVIHASAYEGVRVAIELGASDGAAVDAASDFVTKSAGRLIDDLQVTVGRQETGGRVLVVLIASGSIRPVGLLPVHLPVRVIARSLVPEVPR